MTRRWSLIALIVVLALALAGVIAYTAGVGSDTEPDGKKPESQATSSGKTQRPSPLRGVGWWPAHGDPEDKVGKNDATLSGGTEWKNGPNGGSLQLNGTTGWADTGAEVLDTGSGDYSVAARVRLDAEGEKTIQTAVSQDGDKSSVFFLQYIGPEKKFAFSRVGTRTLSVSAEEPETDRWYHIAGTYSRADNRMKIYVEGKPAGSAEASGPATDATGNLVIGRGKIGGRQVDHWNGRIADVHAYDRALKPDDVADLAAHEPS